METQQDFWKIQTPAFAQAFREQLADADSAILGEGLLGLKAKNILIATDGGCLTFSTTAMMRHTGDAGD